MPSPDSSPKDAISSTRTPDQRTAAQHALRRHADQLPASGQRHPARRGRARHPPARAAASPRRDLSRQHPSSTPLMPPRRGRGSMRWSVLDSHWSLQARLEGPVSGNAAAQRQFRVSRTRFAALDGTATWIVGKIRNSRQIPAAWRRRNRMTPKPGRWHGQPGIWPLPCALLPYGKTTSTYCAASRAKPQGNALPAHRPWQRRRGLKPTLSLRRTSAVRAT